ncbi:hypothetical protein EAF04_000293 [Stromatinia cepivora]|nr:hypothetical protein EAF04_000293 [Stromatinia cepivora]
MAESINMSKGNLGSSSDGETARGVKTWSTAVDVSLEDEYNDPNGNPKKGHLTGWRLKITILAVCLGLFLPNFEVSIVSTSLVSITNDLKGFGQASWVVTAYLITYTGFFIVWAKLSDVFGRKISLMASLIVFAAFSGASAAANSIEILAVLRAFQGIGGSGVYALSMVTVYEMVPDTQYTKMAGLVSFTFALGICLGPLCGGLINEHTTWKWVFLLNVPAAGLAAIVLMISFPGNFPYHNHPELKKRGALHNFTFRSLNKLDFEGAALLLAASIFLVTALQQVETGVKWGSPSIIVLLALSPVCFIMFLVWERFVTKREGIMEPVFPWRFVEDRVWMGMIFNTFLTGIVFTICVIQIPLRLQAVNGLSPLAAGVKLLAYGALVPSGSFVGAALSSKAKLPPIFVLMAGTTFQIIGCALLSTLPTDGELLKISYLYELLAGLGTGLQTGTLIIITPFVAANRDIAVATAAINQFRFLGGSIGLSIVTSVTYSINRPKLLQFLPADTVTTLMQTITVIKEQTPEDQVLIRTLFAQGYNTQMKFATAFAAAEILAIALMWRKRIFKLA